MKRPSNEVKALSGAGARAGLAVFVFTALTAWPLLAGTPADDRGATQAAQKQQATPCHCPRHADAAQAGGLLRLGGRDDRSSFSPARPDAMS
jgi:hypothetical protein